MHIISSLEDIDQVIEMLKTIPRWEFRLSIRCVDGLNHCTPAQRQRIFAAIPEHITEIYFHNDVSDHSNADITQIAMQFSLLPKRLHSLIFIECNFVGTIEEVTNALKTIPDTVRIMELSSCTIDIRDAEPNNAFPLFFAALPRNLTSFHYRNLGEGNLFELTNGEGLAQLAGALPEKLTHLDLLSCQLGAKSLPELQQFFNALTAKPNLVSLNLSMNGLEDNFIQILINTLIAPKSGLRRIQLDILFKATDIKKLLGALKTNPHIIDVHLMARYNKNKSLHQEIDELLINRQKMFALLYHAEMDFLFGRTNTMNVLPAEMKYEILIQLIPDHALTEMPALIKQIDSIIEQAETKALSDYKESAPVVEAWYKFQNACRTEKPGSTEINRRVAEFLTGITSIAVLGQVFEEFMKNVPGYRVDKEFAEPAKETAPPKSILPPGRQAVIRLFQERAQELSRGAEFDPTSTLPHILGVLPIVETAEEPARAGPANA